MHVRSRREFRGPLQEISDTIAENVTLGEFADVWTNPKNYQEDSPYEPFVHAVNSALHKAREIIPSKLGYAKGLTLNAYDNKVDDHVRKDGLKPDGVGILSTRGIDKSRERVRWPDIHLVYESKGHSLKDAICQGGTYARAILTHQQNRIFVCCFLQLFEKSDIYFTIYCRGGCIHSNVIDIRTSKGQEAMAQILLTFLVVPPLYIGVDTSISPNASWITLRGVRLQIQKILAYREAIRGRATRAYLVSKPKVVIEETQEGDSTHQGKTRIGQVELVCPLDDFARNG